MLFIDNEIGVVFRGQGRTSRNVKAVSPERNSTSDQINKVIRFDSGSITATRPMEVIRLEAETWILPWSPLAILLHRIVSFLNQCLQRPFVPCHHFLHILIL